MRTADSQSSVPPGLLRIGNSPSEDLLQSQWPSWRRAECLTASMGRCALCGPSDRRATKEHWVAEGGEGVAG